MILISVVVTCLLVKTAEGHGRLLDPPSRSSMWRFGLSKAVNYNDNQLSCGGYANQHLYHNGKCGVCGDPYQGPRDNEAGGKYATGVMSRRYVSGQMIDIVIEVTANHLGWFEFHMCANNNVSRVVTQDCLNQHLLVLSSGSTRYPVPEGKTGMLNLKAQLPAGLTCSQCIFQWKWHTGRNFGYDANGRNCRGCGAQEEFYGCADVTIVPRVGVITQTHRSTTPPVVTTNPPVVSTRPPLITTRPPPKQTNPTSVPGSIFIPSIFVRPSVSTPAPVTTTQKPVTNGAGTKCHSINLWAGNPVLNQWCITNCAIGNCPSAACSCK